MFHPRKIKTESSDEHGRTVVKKNFSKSNLQQRTIFVGGLCICTTLKDMCAHFEKFGLLESAVLKYDSKTGRSKRFGFLTFTSVKSAEKVLTIDHFIKNTKVNVNKAMPRKLGKFFVGGITSNITDRDLECYFGQFGNIVNIERPSKKKNKLKTYCLITYSNKEDVLALLETTKHTILRTVVEVRRTAPPKNISTRDGFIETGASKRYDSTVVNRNYKEAASRYNGSDGTARYKGREGYNKPCSSGVVHQY